MKMNIVITSFVKFFFPFAFFQATSIMRMCVSLYICVTIAVQQFQFERNLS